MQEDLLLFSATLLVLGVLAMLVMSYVEGREFRLTVLARVLVVVGIFVLLRRLAAERAQVVLEPLAEDWWMLLITAVVTAVVDLGSMVMAKRRSLRGRRPWDQRMAWIVNDVLPMAFAVGLLGALLAVPVIGAAQTAQDPFASAWRFTAFSATLVVLLVLVALLLLDSLAYLYGFHRPFLVIGARWRVEMGAPVITRPMAFVLRSVLAFALTLFWFTLVYESVSHRWCGSFRPGPLDFVSSLYFAIVTAATVGYGDIAPATNAARLLVALQVVVSFGFTVFIFAGIASLARPGGMGPESGDHA